MRSLPKTLSLCLGIALALGGLVYGALIRPALEAAYGGAQIPILSDAVARVPAFSTRDLLRVFDERALLLAIALMLLYSAALYVIMLRRNKGRRALLILVTALVYLGVETLAPKLLVDLVRLDHYRGVRDPDHLPPRDNVRWNLDGLCQTREAADYEDQHFNILFLGDSFTMGYHLSKPHLNSFPTLVEGLLAGREDLPVVRVANCAWASSSPILTHRRFLTIGARYRPDLVVLCLDMTDPHDDIKWRNLIERNGICALYDRIPLTIQLFRMYFPDTFASIYDWSTGSNLPRHRYFQTEVPPDESRPFMDPVCASILRIREHAETLGASFALVVLPRSFQHDQRESPRDLEMLSPRSRHTELSPYRHVPFEFFEDWAAGEGIPYFSALDAFVENEVFPICFGDDPHWNEEGHGVAARAISAFLARRIPELVQSPR